MAEKLPDTPLLDDLEKGPWPSFVTEIKMAAETNLMSKDLLGLLERSYREKIGHWKHGGIVGVLGYGGGVIGRYTDLPEEYPNISHFHTMRINMPAGWWYSTEALRKICDIWEKRGSALTNMHGSTGDIILLGCRTEALEPTFQELAEMGFDIGGSGSDVRTPSCCLGQSRCEWACYDTMQACYDFTMTYQDELHRPAFPYKFKFKFSGCGCDCVAAIARADLSFIGTWRDDIRIDKDALAEYADKGLDIQGEVVNLCPANCMAWDGKDLEIDNRSCVHCMHCIRVMPKALRPGTDTGACVLIGSKAPIIEGAMLSSVIIPFIKMEPPYDDIKEMVDAIWDLWCEEGKNRERVGEFIQRVGLGNFLDAIGMEPVAEMVEHPRENPYIFFEEEEEEEEEDA